MRTALSVALGAVITLSPGLRASPAQANVAGAAEAAALRARGLELGYNLDHDLALDAFRGAIAADPTHPAAHRLVAATMWINLLFRQGAVTAEDFLGQARTDMRRTPPTPEVAATFRAHIDRALELGEQRLRDHPADADAHFQVGAAHGFLTTYQATVEGRMLGNLGAARRAYREHTRAMELDPRRKDAGLIVGMYRYGVSTLPMPMRWMAGLAGFGGGRDKGIRLVEEAAASSSDVRTNALFTLIVFYNREGRYDDALRVIGELQGMYPRNRLLWLESASTALRAARPADALKALEEGLAKCALDARPRAFGEEARWRYYRGAALVELKQPAAAARELDAVLAGQAPDWLRGRAHKELGKAADVSGNSNRALVEYQLAVRLCRASHDAMCASEAAALLKARGR